MAQFPLALALEPRLLPYAVANGFYMDSKYRNFIFRKMFERVPDRTAESIVDNVRELCKLDPSCVLTINTNSYDSRDSQDVRESDCSRRSLHGGEIQCPWL